MLYVECRAHTRKSSGRRTTMTWTLTSAEITAVMVVMAFNLVAWTFTFLLARHLRPSCKVAFRRCAAVFIVGWLVGSIIVFSIYAVLDAIGFEMQDAAKILLSLAVLYFLMDRLF